MTRLWIVRHGNTFEAGEAPRRIGARTDLPLVASGRAQAETLGAWFAREGIAFDRVLTSRLRRSIETAQAIVAAAPLTSVDWLDEIDHGPDEDRPEADVVARIGAGALAAWDRDAVPPPGWVVDPERRLKGWRDLMAGARGDTLLVTSNGAARFALLAEAGLARQAAALPHLKLRTGAWGRLDHAEAAWRLAAWDRRP